MSQEHLYNADAKSKIKELAEDINFAMMATNLDHRPVHVVPMSTKQVDRDGTVWFLSGNDSEHNQHIQRDGQIQLLYSDPGSMRFLTLFGNASVVTTKSILRGLYGSTDDAWFDGVDDPNLTAIQFQPTEGHYWDTKNNKFVTLFKIGVGAITNQQPDLGQHGDLNVKS